MLKTLLLPFSAVFLLPAAALEVTVPLSLVPSAANVNRFSVNVSASVAAGSGTTNASGTMNVRMNVNPTTGKVSELSFEQGRISFSNMNIPLRAFIFVTVANISTSGLQGYAWTPAPPAPVNPVTGDFDGTLHNFTADQGTVNGTTTVQFGDVPAGTTFSADFAEDPISGPAEGTGTVNLTEIPAQATTSTRTWKTTLTLPVSILQTTDLDGTAVSIRLNGTLRAESDVVIPRNEYYAWTITNSLPTPPFDSEIRPDEPHGMVWAMGLEPSSSLRPHLPVITLAESPQAVMTLPPGGTAAPLFIEISDKLTADSWSLAPSATVTGGANPLPAGTKGAINVQLSGPRQFVRLRATAP